MKRKKTSEERRARNSNRSKEATAPRGEVKTAQATSSRGKNIKKRPPRNVRSKGTLPIQKKTVQEFQVEVYGRGIEWLVCQITADQKRALKTTGIRVDGIHLDILENCLEGSRSSGLVIEGVAATANDDPVQIVENETERANSKPAPPRYDFILGWIYSETEHYSGRVRAQRVEDIQVSLYLLEHFDLPRTAEVRALVRVPLEAWGCEVTAPTVAELEFQSGGGGDIDIAFITKDGKVLDLVIQDDDESDGVVLRLG